MRDISHPPPAARSAAAPAARAWLTPRSGELVSVLGGALVCLSLPLPWFPLQHGWEVVLTLTLGERSGWGWIGVGTVIATLSSQVSAFRQPGHPKPIWVYTGLLLVTLYCMGVLPGFWVAAVAGPALVIAPGYWVALVGVVVLWLGSLVRDLTALRPQPQEPASSRPRSRAVGAMSAGRLSQRGGEQQGAQTRGAQAAGCSEDRSPCSQQRPGSGGRRPSPGETTTGGI